MSHESRRHESRDMSHQQMRHQPRDVRSQSEYKISSNPKEGLGQRAQSSPDETELYSEITVCMSQVIHNPRTMTSPRTVQYGMVQYLFRIVDGQKWTAMTGTDRYSHDRRYHV